VDAREDRARPRDAVGCLCVGMTAQRWVVAGLVPATSTIKVIAAGGRTVIKFTFPVVLNPRESTLEGAEIGIA
jgi:hypothetical protein